MASGRRGASDSSLTIHFYHHFSVSTVGAGVAQHFSDVFTPQNGDASTVEAALAAGIFHRKECTIQEVKDHLLAKGFKIRSEAVGEGAGAISKQ